MHKVDSFVLTSSNSLYWLLLELSAPLQAYALFIFHAIMTF